MPGCCFGHEAEPVDESGWAWNQLKQLVYLSPSRVKNTGIAVGLLLYSAHFFSNLSFRDFCVALLVCGGMLNRQDV